MVTDIQLVASLVQVSKPKPSRNDLAHIHCVRPYGEGEWLDYV